MANLFADERASKLELTLDRKKCDMANGIYSILGAVANN